MKVFAHRGASGSFPENTKSAILEALKQAGALKAELVVI